MAARTLLDLHFRAKHKGCKVWAKVYALVREEINVAGWTCSVESQRGNGAIIAIYGIRRLIRGQDEMCEIVYTLFAEL